MTRTILVVDDNPSVTQVLRHVLMHRGYNVVSAPSGAEALLITQSQPMDGAIVDVHMPVMNGIDLCRALREPGMATGHPMPVWLITGAPTPEIRHHALAAGALAVLAKPFEVSELFRLLDDRFGAAPVSNST